MITVTAEKGDQDLGAINRQLCNRLSKFKFPPGYRWELAGEYRAQQDSFASLLMVLIVASALVFLLLGFQFHSLTLPLLIFLTQPISLASAMFALWITGTPLNVSSFMGAHFAHRSGREKWHHSDRVYRPIVPLGLPLEESLVRAGRVALPADFDDQFGHDFRPGAAGIGLGPGAQMQQPLAIAVIGGLIANMLVTRLLIPGRLFGPAAEYRIVCLMLAASAATFSSSTANRWPNRRSVAARCRTECHCAA